MQRTLQITPIIDSFLRGFPKHQWDQCLEVTVTLGVQTAVQLFPRGCSLDTLVMTVQAPPLISVVLAGKKTLTEQKVTKERTPQPTALDAKPPRIQPQNGVSRYKETGKSEAFTANKPSLFPGESNKNSLDSEPKLTSRPQSKRRSHRDKSDRSAPVSPTTSPLAEPRTNPAYFQDVPQPFLFPVSRDSSILRITERFLKDPFLATLSGRSSPKGEKRLS